jgi:hypothetical protein
MSKIYLRVKINSLCEEAKIIRREENRRKYKFIKTPDGKLRKRRIVTDDTVFWGLRTHRTEELRKEARCAYIAYAYLRGKSYRETENNPFWLKPNRTTLRYDPFRPNWSRVADIVLKFGPQKLPKEALILELERWASIDPQPQKTCCIN